MVEPLVQISAIEHYAYCPRQCGLIHVDGIWKENAYTIFGSRAHRRVDTAPSRRERGRRVLRGIPLYSDQYGLIGRADAVEVQDDGSIAPVEYKAGVRHGRAAELQLCAQGICLEEMTNRGVPTGYVWYSGHRRRQRVNLDIELRAETAAIIDEIRSMMVSGSLPDAINDARCGQCQLQSICMPAVVTSGSGLADYVESAVMACE